MKNINFLEFGLKGEFKSRKVWMNGKKLVPKKSQKVNNHSPDGFAWGYGGSGPAQLALAVLLEIFTQQQALNFYEYFKNQIIAHLPKGNFNVTIQVIDGGFSYTKIVHEILDKKSC